MTQENLPSLLSAIVGDVFGAKQWVAGNLAGYGIAQAVQHLMHRRTSQARDILLDEIRHGEKPLSAPEVDESIAVLLRYGRAAQEGAARLNLRLMAKVIAGQAQQSALYADEFLRHANVIAGLRREEVILLGALQRYWNASETWAKPDDNKRVSEVNRLVGIELIPEPFADGWELAAMQSAVLRTGFLADVPAIGGGLYRPTRAFEHLCGLVSIDAALKAEPA